MNKGTRHNARVLIWFAVLIAIGAFYVQRASVVQTRSGFSPQEPPAVSYFREEPADSHAPIPAVGAGGLGAKFWPQWRGPLGTGVAPLASPPVEWSEQKNIRWKVELPGLGHSSPVVWGERVYLTTAIAEGEAAPPSAGRRPGDHDNFPEVRSQRLVVLAINRRDGSIAWQRTVREGSPHEGGHFTGSYASASPVTDGRCVIASFGSCGLYALDTDGEILWRKNLGEMWTKHGHGEGSSPVLYGDKVVVNWDHEGPSFIVAFDKTTGEERWRCDRDEPTSWATPIVVEHVGGRQVVASGTNRIRAYDLDSGEQIWECGGMANNVVASPVAGHGLVFAGSSYEKQALLAIRLDGAKGDITGTGQVAWRTIKRTPYVPSPLLFGEHLYFLRHYEGMLSRLDARTGEEVEEPFRLPLREIYASPVAADGRVYVTGLDGSTIVLGAGVPMEVLARNHLDDRFSASAALAGTEIFLRGARFLYCVSEEQDRKGEVLLGP